MALRMSTPLLFITSSLLFLLSAFSICRNGVNCHSYWFHFIPSICQRVECECVCTWLVGTKCTRDFPAREMVGLRRQELIILLRHSFRSLNVDPHIPPTGLFAENRVTVIVAVCTPSATREVTSDDAASSAFLSSATNLDSAVFVDS